MKTMKEVEEMVLAMPNAVLDYPFDEKTAVYKVGGTDGKMFALIPEDAKPVRVSLKCDPQLAQLLRDKYESVLPGFHLNKKHWNTILVTGQVPDDELHDLIRHSYELVTGLSKD